MPGFELIGPEELSELSSVIQDSQVLFRYGPPGPRKGVYKVENFEKKFTETIGSTYALGVTSGTAALRIALAALGVGPGCEVITSSFTFVATAEAIVEAGATPVFAEIDSTFNADPASIRSLISPNTKAVIAVHMLGVPANLPEIKALCDEFSLFLIEDCAWGCGGKLNGKALGTWGSFGAFSFDYAKTITTGEGGMLVTDDLNLFEKARAWHDHGHANSSLDPRWKDKRVSSGFNFRMSELQGAMGLAQISKLTRIVDTQRQHHQALEASVSDLDTVTLRPNPKDAYSTADAFICSFPTKTEAFLVREALLKNGLSTKILPEALTWHFAKHWQHLSKDLTQEAPDFENSFPYSSSLLERSVALPISLNMTTDYLKMVLESFKQGLTL